jgi:hypothetical protein
MTAQNPVFDLTVINPDIIIGPMLQPVDGPKNINESNLFAIYDFFNGKYTDIEHVTFPFYHFVRSFTLILILLWLTKGTGGRSRCCVGTHPLP